MKDLDKQAGKTFCAWVSFCGELRNLAHLLDGAATPAELVAELMSHLDPSDAANADAQRFVDSVKAHRLDGTAPEVTGCE